MSLDEYAATFKEGAETPTALSGHGQYGSRLLAPLYEGYDNIWCYGWSINLSPETDIIEATGGLVNGHSL